MAEENEDKSLGFKWLKKRGVGGSKKKIQFYESFVYDEVEYSLYDSVYMYKEGYPKPYIGKVIKIWEHEDKTKKVKVQWFFHVWEILNFLGDKKTHDKEIFLACGEGFGVANINSLEAIAGKCNVVCISKDSRNAQPSDEELEAADYLFYRTFDVQSFTILDKMDEKVGELKIQNIFNKNTHENVSSIPKLISKRKDTKNATEYDETVQLSSQNPPGISITMKTDENENQSVARRESNYDETKASKGPTIQVKTKERARFAQDSNNLKDQPDTDLKEKLPTHENGVKAPTIQVKIKETTSAQDIENSRDQPGKKTRGDNAIKPRGDKDSNEKLSINENGAKAPAIQAKVKERATSARDSDNLKTQPGHGKKANGDNDTKLREDKDLKEKLLITENGMKTPSIQAEVKERATSAHVSGNLNAQPGKKDRGDNSIKSPEGKDMKEKDAHEDGVKTPKGKDLKEKTPSTQDFDKSKDQPGEKAMGDNSIKPPKGKDLKEKVPVRENGVKAGVTISRLEEKLNDPHGKSFPRTGKRVKFAHGDDPEGWPSKKAKVDHSLKPSEDKDDNRNKIQNLSTDNNGSNAKDVKPTDKSSEEHKKSRLVQDSLGTKKGSNKEQPDEKVSKLSGRKLRKVSAIELEEKNTKTAYQEFEITRRPDDDKSRWFRELPWEERLQKAYEQGTLVLLQNLDPEYTSEEVEGIIWHAFNESCSAKMVPYTAISSPFSGREATERVMKKLGTGILMLSNGRPLVGSRGPPPNLSGRRSTFFGHLVIDKIKLQMQREMKDAVSTSHCSQPNTIEYEMAMEWCLLQARSEISWNLLYKDQRKQLEKLGNNLEQK